MHRPSDHSFNIVNDKNANIEKLRIIAAFGIVCFHAQSGLPKLIGYVGLPVFVILTFRLGIVNKYRYLNETKNVVFKQYLMSKYTRLIIPFIYWVIIYWVWGWIRMATGYGEIVEVPITILFPLYGTSIHLWYIPFVFIGLSVVSFIKLYTTCNTLVLNTFFLFSIFFFGMIPLVFPSTNLMPIPIPQIIFALPAIFLGLIISEMTDEHYFTNYFLPFILIIFVGMIRLIFDNGDSFLILYPTAFLAVIFCIEVPGKINKSIEFLSSLTFGIYLVHPIVIAIVTNLLALFKCDNLFYIISPIVFIISSFIIYFLKRSAINCLF